MLFIRNLIYWLILIASLIFLFPLVLPALLLPNGVLRVGRLWAKVLMWSLKHIIGLDYRVRGSENIPDRPSIVCAKHQSGWETLAIQMIFPPVVFVAKKELFRIPFFGWGLKLAKTIGIERNSIQANKQLLEQGLARKNEGLWIAIFPEGTRIPAGEKGRYKLGGARMAKLFEMDIVPVALNSGEFWPRNSFMKYPGIIDVVICEPLSYHYGSETELMAECERRIETAQSEINGTGYLAHRQPMPSAR